MARVIVVHALDAPLVRRAAAWVKDREWETPVRVVQSVAEAKAVDRQETLEAVFVEAACYREGPVREFWSGYAAGSLPLVVLTSEPLLAPGAPTERCLAPDEWDPWLDSQRDRSLWIWQPFAAGALSPSTPQWTVRDRLTDFPRGPAPTRLVADFRWVVRDAPRLWGQFREWVRELDLPSTAVLGPAVGPQLATEEEIAALGEGRCLWGDGGGQGWDAPVWDEWLRRRGEWRTYVRQAEHLFSKNQPLDAFRALDHGVASHPAGAPLWEMRAQVATALGKTAAARESLHQAVLREPYSKRRWIQWVDWCAGGADSEALGQALREAIRRFPWEGRFRRELAQWHLGRGDRTAADWEGRWARALGM